MNYHWAGLFLSLCLGIFGCNSDNSETGDHNSGSSSDNQSAGGNVTGQLEVDSDTPEGAISKASVFVEGHPEISTVSDSSGKFTLKNAPSGSLTIFATSEEGQSAGLLGAASYGVKASEIFVRPQETTSAGNLTMKKTGSISGTVLFYENPNNLDLTGSDVFVPGTGFIVKTAADGSFALAGLPEGSYTFRMQHVGFAASDIAAIEVVSGEKTDLGERLLSISRGPEGAISVDADVTISIDGHSKKIIKNRSVDVNLSFDSDAALMKISDEPSFLNKTWENVSTSRSWTFTSDGNKSLYVMFSDLNGLESSPYNVEFIIDTEKPKLNGVSLLYGWSQSSKQTVFLDAIASDSGSGIKEIMLSESSSFSGASWQTYASPVNFTLSSGNGAKKVYVKIRDYADNVSALPSSGTPVNDSINLDTSASGRTLLPSGNIQGNIVLKKAQSPFLINGNTTFLNDLTVEAGSVVYFGANNYELSIEGVFTAKGTSAGSNRITFQYDVVSCASLPSISMLEAAAGVSEQNLIQFVDFKRVVLKMNGGTITENTFDGTGCSLSDSLDNAKDGLDNLEFTKNDFTEWRVALEVITGNSNTIYSENTGDVCTMIFQRTNATGTKATNNTHNFLSCIASYRPLVLQGGDISDASGNNFTFDSATEPVVRYQGTGSQPITVNKLNLSSCYAVAENAANGASAILKIKNSTITGCSYAALYEQSAGCSGRITFDHNNITVSKAFVYTNYPSSSTNYLTSFTNNNLTCSNASGKCDLYFHEGMSNISTMNVNLLFNDNNIHCIGDLGVGSNGCRGVTVQGSSASSSVANFDTFDFDDNFWKTTSDGKLFTSGNFLTVLTSDAPLNSEVRFYNLYGGGGSLTITGLPGAITTRGSLVLGAGPE